MPPQRTKFITHLFGGGWATDFGQNYYNAPDRDQSLVMPFLPEAINVVYEFNGGPHKCPGTDAMTDTTVGAAAEVVGVFDYWRQGTSDSPAQKIIIHHGTVVAEANLGGTFSDLQTGLESGKVPHYTTFDDFLIYASDSTTDVPSSWDQTTRQNLAGSPPNFSFSKPHKNYLFASGVAANPSRVYWPVNVDPEDWTGSGSGNIDVNPGDGDHVTAIWSHRNELIVFKGPYKGSISRITGSSLSDFALTTLVDGVGAGWINTVFPFGSDLGFVTPTGSIRSLDATAAFGDYDEAALSYPIESYVRTKLNHSRIRNWWAVNDSPNSRVLIACSSSSAIINDTILCMDYRFMAQGERYPRWSRWDAFKPLSLAMVNDTNNRRRPFGGDNAGLVQKYEQPARTANGGLISMSVKTPFLSYGSEILMKTIETASIGINPKNNNDITFGHQRDNLTPQTQTIAQSGAANSLDDFLLDVDILDGESYLSRFLQLEEGGDFRIIQYQITDAVADSDLEFHNIGAQITVDAVSTEN